MSSQLRPFTAATSKLAYAQAFTRTSTHTGRGAGPRLALRRMRRRGGAYRSAR